MHRKVRSIVIMVNAQLRFFEIPEIKRIFEGTDDIDIPSLGLGVDGNPEKKTALFLVMPSGDSSYNLFSENNHKYNHRDNNRY